MSIKKRILKPNSKWSYTRQGIRSLFQLTKIHEGDNFEAKVSYNDLDPDSGRVLSSNISCTVKLWLEHLGPIMNYDECVDFKMKKLIVAASTLGYLNELKSILVELEI